MSLVLTDKDKYVYLFVVLLTGNLELSSEKLKELFSPESWTCQCCFEVHEIVGSLLSTVRWKVPSNGQGDGEVPSGPF